MNVQEAVNLIRTFNLTVKGSPGSNKPVGFTVQGRVVKRFEANMRIVAGCPATEKLYLVPTEKETFPGALDELAAFAARGPRQVIFPSMDQSGAEVS